MTFHKKGHAHTRARAGGFTAPRASHFTSRLRRMAGIASLLGSALWGTAAQAQSTTPPDCKIGTDNASAYVTPVSNLQCTVPASFTGTKLKVTVVGGGGGFDPNGRPATRGGGGGVAISSTFPATAGQQLTITVGAAGSLGSRPGSGGLSSLQNTSTNPQPLVTASGGAPDRVDGSASTSNVSLDANSPTSWAAWDASYPNASLPFKDPNNLPVGSSSTASGSASGMVLLSLVPNAAPVASNVTLQGAAQVGQVLSGSYSYKDADSDPEGTSTYRWVRNSVDTGITGGTDAAAGNTNGATGADVNYTLVPADVGQYLFYCVTPVASSGTLTGTEVCSNVSFQIIAAPTPGVCGTASGVATAGAPSQNLCSAGAAGTVSSTGGQWAWSCNGTGGSTVNVSCAAPFQTQTISLEASPLNIPVNGTSSITTNNSTSGLTPALSTTTATVCSLSGMIVTGLAGGTCTVQATIAKSADSCGDGEGGCYQAAEKQLDITVSKTGQTISPITLSTTTLPVGGTATASTSSNSGLIVSFSGTAGICSVSSAAATAANYVQTTAAADSTTVTALGVGTCTITASQAGNTSYNAATPVTATIEISASAPAAPTNLSARAGNRSATISFTAGSNGGAPISNYEYSLDGGISWMPLTPAVSASPVTINGLSNGQTYLISLRAVNSSGSGEASSQVSVRPRAPSNGGGTPPPSPPSAAPAGISASGAANGQVTLSFTPPGGTVTNYEYSLDGGQTFLPFSPAVKSSPVTIKGLSDGLTYTIVLRAVNSDGSGPASLPVLVTPMMDTDLDGVGDATESPVPDADGTGTGDGNGDGVADGAQSSVTSLVNPAGVYTTLVSSSGRTLKSVSLVNTPADFPSDAGSVFSGVSFSISGLAVGAAEVLELYVPSSAGTVTGLRKKNLRTGSWDVIPATISTVGSKTRIVYSLTDGGDYDSDGAANGAISDPVFVVGSTTQGDGGGSGGGSGSGGGGGALSWQLLSVLALLAARRRRRLH